MTARRLAPIVAAALILAGLLLPDRWDGLGIGVFAQIPLELPLLLLALALAPRWVAIVAGLLLALMVLVKLADMGAYQAMGRPFNPVLDFALLGPAWEVLAASAGPAAAWAAAVGATVLAAGLALALAWSAGVLARFARPRRKLAAMAGGVLSAAGGVVLLLWPGQGVVSAQTSRLAYAQVLSTWASVEDLDTFSREAAVDPFRDVPAGGLLAALAGKDVLIVFIESYGRAALDSPWYAQEVRQSLRRFEATLAGRGFAARSGFLVSPTFGGQSWLAHATLASGLRIDNQRRYASLIASERGTLTHDFARAGWRTVAVMPAITKAWPEAGFFGYDRVYAAADLEYRGLPFDWVTMPDQFTLEAFDRQERRIPGRRPLMAEVALLSSHLPWTPLPELIDWDQVGDGTVFNRFVEAGEDPDVLWRDTVRLREQYRRSIDYSLATLASYIATRGDANLVVIALGDHEPISLVSGPNAGHEVPVHVVAADPAILQRLDSWGFSAGMVPAPEAPVWPMEAFRGHLLAAFTPAAGVAAVTGSAP